MIYDIIEAMKDRFNYFDMLIDVDCRNRMPGVFCEIYCNSMYLGGITFYDDCLKCYGLYGLRNYNVNYVDLDVDIIAGLFLCEAHYDKRVC